MATLVQFLVKLGESSALRKRFLKEPHVVCKEEGLSAEDQKALRTNDPVAKATALGAGKLSDSDWIVTKAEDWIVGGNK